MGLSSNILWHQTDKKSFYDILKSKMLLYSYCLERVIPTFHLKPVAFPMISVSDYPFSEIAHNNWTYGNYCIGFNRSWGVNVGFSPVWYCSTGSRGLRQLDVLLKEGMKPNEKGLFGVSMFLFAQMKLDQAPLYSSKRQFRKYRFYDEREWRIVPYITETDEAEVMPFLTEEGYAEYKTNHGGGSLLDFGVDFQYDDIHYIIVELEEDVQAVKEIVGGKCHVFTKGEVMADVVGVNHHDEIIPSPEVQDMEAGLRHLDRMRKRFEEEWKKRKSDNK